MQTQHKRAHARVRASDAIKSPGVKAKAKISPPIRASELVKRRHAEALSTMERTITQREQMFQRMARMTSKLYLLAKQVRRYEQQIGA